MRKFIVLMWLLVLMCASRAMAQTLVLHHEDSSITDIPFTSQASNTFSDGKTVVGNFSYAAANILKITYVPDALPVAGDLNGDGNVDVGDIMIIINIMADQTTGIDKVKADLNGDGNVDVGDIMAIINIMAGGTKPVETAYLSCPDGNHPHMIDLGLPSGTLWACCNVGASTPEDYGGYYAWGETCTKSTYNWDTYQYGSSWDNMVNIGSDIAGTQYDAATANWGASWRMPSLTQIQELLNNCTSTWATQNGVNGRKFTGSNGGTIFLPAAGFRWNDDLCNAGSYGDYWSSMLDEIYPYGAYDLYFLSGDAYWGKYYRYFGRSVRPVR